MGCGEVLGAGFSAGCSVRFSVFRSVNDSQEYASSLYMPTCWKEYTHRACHALSMSARCMTVLPSRAMRSVKSMRVVTRARQDRLFAATVLARMLLTCVEYTTPHIPWDAVNMARGRPSLLTV